MEGRSELDHAVIRELFESLQVTGVPLCTRFTVTPMLAKDRGKMGIDFERSTKQLMHFASIGEDLVLVVLKGHLLGDGGLMGDDR